MRHILLCFHECEMIRPHHTSVLYNSRLLAHRKLPKTEGDSSAGIRERRVASYYQILRSFNGTVPSDWEEIVLTTSVTYVSSNFTIPTQVYHTFCTCISNISMQLRMSYV